MQLTMFDNYTLRARLSVYMIIISPLILTLYIYFEVVRYLGTSIIIIFLVAAFSNYFLVLERYLRKNDIVDNTASTMLYHENNELNIETKKRYYKTLASVDNSFTSLNSETDNDLFKKACDEAVIWLRNYSRNNHLVQEENILYGFIRNAIQTKTIGLTLLTISLFIQFVLTLRMKNTFALESDFQYMILMICYDVFLLLFWLIGVTNKLRVFIARKYAIALLSTIDSIIIPNEHK